MKKMTVALIFGGEGREHDISVMGADFIADELRLGGMDVLRVLIKKNGEWCIAEGDADCAKTDAAGKSLGGAPEDPAESKSRDKDSKDQAGGNGFDNTPDDLRGCEGAGIKLTPVFPVRLGDQSGFLCRGEIISIDAALPLLHGELGEDGIVQGALRCAGIPFIGCDTVCGAVGIDKAFTKLIAEDAGIPVARGIYSTEHDTAQALIKSAEDTLAYPMFVKPTRLGSSIGAGIARGRDELSARIKEALTAGSGRIMIEECLSPARELECAVMCINGKLLFTDIGEIACDSGFYDYENKYGSESSARIIECAELPRDKSELVKSYAAIIAERLGVRGFSRIDFLLCGDRIYFNEINTTPGMTEISMFPRLAQRCGMPMRRLLRLLAEEAIK